MFSGLHGTEWIIILFVVLLIFGPTQLPKLMKTIGEGIKALKKASSDSDSSETSADSKEKKQ
ncbi:TPA: twin-arginine translocase TatA/TatE family subunit [bacterium]|nr:MAG: hypothetical protein AUJ18_01580 [Candidatus Hydrogenedentes bacterium CG1_02_42_14]PIU48321.1 MAG: twin-arginine translocase TatA/TatE family subunit [Candidatus Hydrogenedentes bacterium CG07_land_8_20_14_0_80_42_17]HBW47063.1 twin-arginine translocase TatA/TatE family subunit [bacterium]